MLHDLRIARRSWPMSPVFVLDAAGTMAWRYDFASPGLAGLIVARATFLGCWLPARRATHVSPITARRTD
jgi:hypothetical protein